MTNTKWTTESYLCHHGIRGQKWGVRRFQNPDGSLTEAGKRRYFKPKDFRAAEKLVKSKLGNGYSAFKEEALSIPEIQKRGKLTEEEAMRCASIATDIFTRASKAEPKITKDVISAATDAGAGMYGLEHRLKQPTSIAAKIGSDSKDAGVSFKDAAKGLKDAIRYTAVSKSKDFTDNYQRIKQRLKSKGYTEVRCKNYFKLYAEGKVKHKAVQSVFEDKNGNKFELQFQTPASQAAKELKIPIYEARRRTGLSDKEKRDLEKQMTDLAENVPNPSGVMKIKSH